MKNLWKKHSKILIFIPSLLITVPVLFWIFLLVVSVVSEPWITYQFESEVKRNSEIKVKDFYVSEGVVFVKVDIVGKGEVALMYGKRGLGEIRRIDKFNTAFECHNYPDIWIKYLNFRKDSYFFKNISHMFPFEINNLKDLVNHYDDIVKVLETFPWDGQKNAKFSFPIQDRDGKAATCYLKGISEFNWPN